MGINLGGILKGIGKVAGGALGILGGPVGSLVGTGLGLLTGSKDKKTAKGLREEGLGVARGEWQAGAPLRSRARAMALAPMAQRPDLSGIFADPGNPFSRPIDRSTIPGGIAPMPPPSLPVPGVSQPGGGGAGVFSGIGRVANRDRRLL